MAFEKYGYDLTEIAETDIDAIFEYIVSELSNEKAASDFADEFEEKIEKICKAPKTGRIVENEYLKRDDVRRFLVGNYVAYYVIDENNQRIVILRVVYGKRDQNLVLKDI
ncbi:MAG: type II toxin-antitoxin system RelE/ParE family toxin [Lachnospiraceae bacterium]|nr:type II toxin-antitoxin system RelE/ParE family toxin [Lachnospiraceae bacterium]